MLSAAIELAQAAGAVLLQSFGGRHAVVAHKGDISNVLTEADLAAERVILDGLQCRFPRHGVIAEETGFLAGSSEYTWIVDPLDGSSNYAAGIPWFGVLIALLHEAHPVAAVLQLPVSGETYTAEAGGGAFLNGRRIAVSQAESLSEVLWAYGMDAPPTAHQREQDARLLSRLLARVRNVRATNSLVDAALTADGRLGGMLNRSTRIWDIAAPLLIVSEAGGLYTTPSGAPLSLSPAGDAPERIYEVLAGAPQLHRQVVDLIGDDLQTRHDTPWP
jgi:myo-inositol-1(or 4)-monophosphatase